MRVVENFLVFCCLLAISCGRGVQGFSHGARPLVERVGLPTLCAATGKCFDNIDDFVLNEAARQDEEPQLGEDEKACYPGLGCFTKGTGEMAYLNELPKAPSVINAQFTIYGQKLNATGKRLDYQRPGKLPSAGGSAEQWLTLVIHGFASGPHAQWVSQLKDAVLSDLGGFVVVVDWHIGSAIPDYVQAAANTQLVGRMAARLVHGLILANPASLSAKRLHWIGHSLGAQMGHFFSKYLQLIGSHKPARITGLDAAGPEFESHGVFVNRDDADFVEGLHTSAGDNILTGELGMTEPYGHVDFYPNGGREQPGCSAFSYACGHSRSHELYVEARMSRTCRFHSYSCAGGLEQYIKNKCVRNATNSNELGLRSNLLPGRGVQFFETNRRKPFCRIDNDDHKSSLKQKFLKFVTKN